MKTIDRGNRFWLLGASIVLGMALTMAACSDDKTSDITDGDASQPIAIQNIIASPKSASPGDTLMLSVIVVSDSPNVGDIPTVAWTASGGAFLENNQATVRWVAPVGGVYSVTARATNSINSVSSTADVFVGGVASVVASQAGAIRVLPNGTDIYYSRTLNNLALGVEVFSVMAGAVGDAVEIPAALDGVTNDFLAYAPDLSFEVHAADSVVPGSDTNPVHLYLGDFATKSFRRISSGAPAADRYPGFADPDVSSDSRYIAYGGMLPTPLAIGADTFDVFVYDRATPSRQNVTRTHSNHRNAFPTWSTDHRWLTFVSDRSARGQWDLYGMPITGGVINTAQASLVRLSNTGGLLVAGSIGTVGFRKPQMAWNPVTPTLAIVASDGFLYLIITTPGGATQVSAGGPSPDNLAWSPDGSMLAFQATVIVDTPTGQVATSGVVTVSSNGSNSQVRVARAGDTFADIAWSPNGQWLVYRATRGSSAWFEAFDLDGSTVSVPIPITPSDPAASALNSLGGYRGFMSMRPAWGSQNILFYTTFGTGAATVGIRSVDVSGLTP